MTGHVTIGVPVYRGERLVADTVDTVVAQTHDDWDLVFSVDGPDPASEAVCRRYLDDPRFRLVVQPERLGWVRNIAWLQEQATAEFWVYLQQDDLLDPAYLTTLMQEADRSPEAAVVYCDIQCFGTRTTRFARPSIVGSPVGRMLSLLTDHFAGVAFRGLTRVPALRATDGGLVGNDADDFAAEVGWIAAMASWGDLIRVPGALYHKRYHDEQVHTAWSEWDLARRRRAWAAHCHDVLGTAMTVPSRPSERWLLWFATIERLTASRASAYLPWAEFNDDDRFALVDALIERIVRLGRIDLPERLGSDWADVRRRTVEYLGAQPVPPTRGRFRRTRR